MNKIKEVEKKEEVSSDIKMAEQLEAIVSEPEKVIESKDMVSGKYYKTVQTRHVNYVRCVDCMKDLDGGYILRVENLVTQTIVSGIDPSYKLVEMDSEVVKDIVKDLRHELGFSFKSSQIGKNNEEYVDESEEMGTVEKVKVKKDKGPSIRSVIVSCLKKGDITKQGIVDEVKKVFPDADGKKVMGRIGLNMGELKKQKYNFEIDSKGVIKTFSL